MNKLFPSVKPPNSQATPPKQPAPPLIKNSQPPQQSQSPSEHPLESVVVQEIPVTMTMDHVTGGVTMAATPTQTPCSPSRSPDPSSHASPPTSSSPGESTCAVCNIASYYPVAHIHTYSRASFLSVIHFVFLSVCFCLSVANLNVKFRMCSLYRNTKSYM